MQQRFLRHVVSTVGISVLQQFVGLARQILIAAYFGVSRDYDGYLVVYSLASLVVFNLSMVFDTVAVSRLVQIRERHGDQGFWRASNRLLMQCIGGGVVFAVALLGIVQLALPIVAAGFSLQERAAVSELARYFLPWIVIIIPYYAVSAHLKALWRFQWVFAAEIGSMVVSVGVLVVDHQSVSALPIAYGAGYLAAFAALLLRRGMAMPPATVPTQGLLRGMANQHLANQIGTATNLVDRYFQSFLAPGGISALGYTGQIVNNLSSLLTFREIYVVPLASSAGREEKLERILKGVVLISVPSACFIVAFAGPIVQILLQRGHFTAEAAMLTAAILRIQALSLVVSSLLAPMVRLFQILDRIAYSHALYLASLIGTAALQYLFVFRLGWDVYGIAWASVGNSLFVTMVVAALVRRCGIVIPWHRILGYLLFSASAAGIATVCALLAASTLVGLPALAGGGAVYAAIVMAFLFAIRQRLRAIVGVARSA